MRYAAKFLFEFVDPFRPGRIWCNRRCQFNVADDKFRVGPTTILMIMGIVECADENYVCTANKELILDSSRAVQIIVRKAGIVRGPKPLNGGGEPFAKALGTVEL